MTASQESAVDSLFVIDKTGGESDCKPLKKLKRRNEAIYNDGD